LSYLIDIDIRSSDTRLSLATEDNLSGCFGIYGAGFEADVDVLLISLGRIDIKRPESGRESSQHWVFGVPFLNGTTPQIKCAVS
jgi:hypothetical protein